MPVSRLMEAWGSDVSADVGQADDSAPERCLWNWDRHHPQLLEHLPEHIQLDLSGGWLPHEGLLARPLVENPERLFEFESIA